jgi:spermidine/putrescine transport system permease protein
MASKEAGKGGGKDRWFAAAAAPWIGSLLAFFVLPLAGLLLLSLTVSATDGATQFSLVNYATIIDLSSGRLEVLGRTLRIGFTVVGLSLLLSIPVAYHLAKIARSPRFESLVLLLVSTTFLAGPLVRTVSWRGILGVHGLINEALTWTGIVEKPLLSLLYGEPAMILALTYNAFPFLLFTAYLGMKVVDDRHLAAARDLGATPAAAFFRVALPLAAPGIVTGAVLVFVPTLSAVLEPEILGGTSSRLMATAIRDQFFHARNWPLGATLTILLIVVGGAAIGFIGLLFAWLCRFLGRFGLPAGAR